MFSKYVCFPKYCPTLLSFFFSFFLFAQEKGTDPAINEAINKQGKAFIKDKQINSVSIGIYKDGKYYTQHFGELEKGQGNPPTNNTLYEIGSVTKPMTGYLAAQAVLDGKLALTDQLIDYLEGDYEHLSAITLQQLLTHTAGLPMFLPLEMAPLFEDLEADVPTAFYELEQRYSKEQFFKDLKEIELISEPGATYAYSNLGAELMGHVLEVAYGEAIDSLFEAQLFGPAQMESTGIRLSQDQLQYLTQGYWMNNTTRSPNQLNPLWATGSGAKATLPDMLKFMAWELNPENPVVTESQKVLFEGERLLKVAYFWRVWDDKYGRSYNHHGGTPGMQNWLFLFPKYNMGISILTNQSGPKTPGKLNAAVKKLLKSLVKA